MHPWRLWQDDPKFVELGASDADIATSVRADEFTRYLGVGHDERRIAKLQAAHPEVARQLTASNRRKLALNNNADILVLRGSYASSLFRYDHVRHAKWVVWPCGLQLAAFVGMLGFVCHFVLKRFSVPRIVTFRTPAGKARYMFAARVLRPKNCRRNSLHFFPHTLGLEGAFRSFDEREVRYVVLRWFEQLPEIAPAEDVDILVADDSLTGMLDILHSQPGIVPCDVFSEGGLARSAYCGMPYYPPHVAKRVLDGAVLFRSMCAVPNANDHFHSLAYHAVYHKGLKSNLSCSDLPFTGRIKSSHDFAAILKAMAVKLRIDVEISLRGLHEYLQRAGWGPTPEMLARLSRAGKSNVWLKLLADELAPHVNDQGLAVFVLREEAVRRGLTNRLVGLIRDAGFDVLSTYLLDPDEIEFAAARTRGGNWEAGRPFSISGGRPAAAVICYDRTPISPNRRQRRKFPKRTNARIFAKESIRDTIIAELPPGEDFNALHSSDHAAEAWHLIEILAPRLLESTRAKLAEIHGQCPAPGTARRQAA